MTTEYSGAVIYIFWRVESMVQVYVNSLFGSKVLEFTSIRCIAKALKQQRWRPLQLFILDICRCSGYSMEYFVCRFYSTSGTKIMKMNLSYVANEYFGKDFHDRAAIVFWVN